MSTLLSNKIKGNWNFFSRIFITGPSVHTFCQNFEGYITERIHEIERHLLVHISTISNKNIHEDKTIFFRIFITCPPVHTFCQNCEWYIAERKHEIERHLLVHLATLSNKNIHEVETIFLEFLLLVRLSTLFVKILKYRKKTWNRLLLAHSPHF